MKNFRVSYVRKSQIPTNPSDLTKLPVHTVVVEAFSPSEAMLLASKPGRIVYKATSVTNRPYDTKKKRTVPFSVIQNVITPPVIETKEEVGSEAGWDGFDPDITYTYQYDPDVTYPEADSTPVYVSATQPSVPESVDYSEKTGPTNDDIILTSLLVLGVILAIAGVAFASYNCLHPHLIK